MAAPKALASVPSAAMAMAMAMATAMAMAMATGAAWALAPAKSAQLESVVLPLAGLGVATVETQRWLAREWSRPEGAM